MKKLISVIVCTYNQEDTIARTLDSILRQQCSLPIEILIGEDCSTDGTLAVCKSYADKYPDIIRLFANNPNKGIIDNYFDCILAAQGEYIADLAGDDEWSDTLKLEKALQVMEAHPEVSVVHTDYQCRNTETNEVTMPSPSPYFSCGKGKLEIVEGKQLLVPILTQLSRPVIHLCTSLYRTSSILKAYNEHTELFRNEAYNCEDVVVSFMLAYYGKVAYINEPSLLYSVGESTISNTHSEEKQWKFIKGATQQVFDIAKKFGIKDANLSVHISYRIYAMLMHSFRVHSKEMREETLRKQQLWNADLTFKSRLVKFMTSSSLLWTLSLCVRNIVVSFKQK